MRNATNKLSALSAAIAAAMLAAQANAIVFNLNQSESRVWIEGTSTLHSFSVAATSMDFVLTFNKDADLGAALSKRDPMDLKLIIPTQKLKSEHPDLDLRMRKALKADAFPDIIFTLTDYGASPEGSGYAISARGRLSIAGVTKSETVIGTVASASGISIIDGQEPLLMSDFGIKPPTLMLGALKTGDRVLVKFHLEIKPSDGKGGVK